MFRTLPKELEKVIHGLQVLVVDDNAYTRRMIRTVLNNVGIKNTHEAGDGIAGLEAIRTFSPHVCIIDWEMPLLNGAEMVRIVRSPGVFPTPDLPIIMLSGYAERWRVLEAQRLGANEFLIKPVSGKLLFERIVSILKKPRPAVRSGDDLADTGGQPLPEMTSPSIVPDERSDHAPLPRAAP
jgi:CheY-like chemotaxis protein